jgi:hypothetical protein
LVVIYGGATTDGVDEVHGKGNGIVRIGGVREAARLPSLAYSRGSGQVHAVGGIIGISPIFENFAVNWIGTNLIVNFAENSFGPAVRRLTWSCDHCNE